jgi:methanesulfonate monooxygenase small subunit
MRRFGRRQAGDQGRTARQQERQDMSANATSVADQVKDAIYRSCLLLDDERWDDWLSLCDAEFQYKITSFSPEIRKDMIYFSGSKPELANMCEMLPKHNTDHSPLKRHAVVYTVDVSDDGASAEAVTSFVIYQNLLDGVNSHVDAGESRLFCVGRYIDRLAIDDGGAKLVAREVRLENRRLDKGSHWPL